MGSPEAALADYTEAIRIDPNYASAYFNRANEYSQWGNYEAALADLYDWLELQPEDAEDSETVEEWIAELEAKISGP